MSEASYEFDPCSIDGSDQEETVTLDNWKPSTNKPKIIPSKWRQDSIGNDFNQQPGIDELHKILMHLKRKVSDSDIMKAFGINAQTLVAIKKDKYDPVTGISLDNQSKIYKEFKRLENKIEKIMRGLNYIAEIMFIEKSDLTKFKKILNKPKIEKPIKKIKVNENGEYDELCEQNDDFSGEEE